METSALDAPRRAARLTSGLMAMGRTADALGRRGVLILLAVCMAGQLLWVLLVMPETKPVSLEQIQKRLGIE